MTQTQHSQLYRQQAIDAQKSNGGSPLLKPTLSHVMASAILISLACASALFISTQPFTQTVVVRGWLQAGNQELSVTANDTSAVIERVWVANGQAVTKGDPLLKLKRNNHILLGERGIQELSEFNHIEYKNKHRQYAVSQQHTQTLMEHTKAQINAKQQQTHLVEQQLITHKQQLALYQQHWQEAKLLATQQAMPLVELEQRQLNYLAQQQQYSQLQREQWQLNAEQIRLQKVLAEHQHVFGEVNTRKKKLDIEYQKQQLSFNQGLYYTVYADQSGVVENLDANLGDSVAFGHVLMHIVPRQPYFIAKLAIPASHSGFVKVGQDVQVQLAGFSYQKYGFIEGQIRHIAKQVSIPKNMSSSAVYVAEVTLSQQHIEAKQSQQTFSSGMHIIANIEQEQRTVLEWLLEPVFELKRQAI
ncbi:MAG: HlyD family efflux transporter periplasmic adaptor subunit [Glaciecola sp.]